MDFSNLQGGGHSRRAGRFLDAHPFLSRENVRSARVPLGLSAGIRILDVGCGTGDGTRALARAVGPGGHVLGVDPDPDLLALAAGKGPMPQLAWVQARGCSVPEPTSSYDVCWLDRVLAHCTRPGDVVSEMRRLLKPGGRLFSCEIEYSAISFAICTEPVRALHEQYVRSLRSPDVAGQLRGMLSAEFGSSLCLQRREELMYRTRGELSRALALRLWTRAQIAMGCPSVAYFRAAARDLAALEHAGTLRVAVPIRWSLMWTSPDA